MSGEALISLQEIATVLGGRKTPEDVRREAIELELFVQPDWKGSPCLSASEAKSLVDGSARQTREHERRRAKHLKREAEWQQAQVAAANAAAERVRAEHVGHVDGEALGRQYSPEREAWIRSHIDEHALRYRRLERANARLLSIRQRRTSPSARRPWRAGRRTSAQVVTPSPRVETGSCVAARDPDPARQNRLIKRRSRTCSFVVALRSPPQSAQLGCGSPCRVRHQLGSHDVSSQ